MIDLNYYTNTSDALDALEKETTAEMEKQERINKSFLSYLQNIESNIAGMNFEECRFHLKVSEDILKS